MTVCFRETTAASTGNIVEESRPDIGGAHARGRGRAAPLHSTYAAASENFAELFRQVEEHREVVVIHRREHEDVALVRLSDLVALLESAASQKAPAGHRRLFAALREALELR